MLEQARPDRLLCDVLVDPAGLASAAEANVAHAHDAVRQHERAPVSTGALMAPPVNSRQVERAQLASSKMCGGECTRARESLSLANLTRVPDHGERVDAAKVPRNAPTQIR